MPATYPVSNPEEFSPERLGLVRDHLKDVFASKAFAGSKRAQDFLQLIVEHALAGRVFLFAYLFVNKMLPTMNAATQLDAGLGHPGQGTYESIARSAGDSLSHLPPGMLIHDTATGRVDVASALEMARSVAAKDANRSALG